MVLHIPNLSPNLLLTKDGKFRRGTHLAVKRPLGYWHHGIYYGWRKVIHHSGWSKAIEKGRLEITSFEEFANGTDVHAVEHDTLRPWREVIATAKSALERADAPEWQYSLSRKNCEHFATFCSTGRFESEQVKEIKLLLLGPVGTWLWDKFVEEE